jgi:hypothetical protein
VNAGTGRSARTASTLAFRIASCLLAALAIFAASAAAATSGAAALASCKGSGGGWVEMVGKLRGWEGAASRSRAQALGRVIQQTYPLTFAALYVSKRAWRLDIAPFTF